MTQPSWVKEIESIILGLGFEGFGLLVIFDGLL
jgi:hypothetical protein